jgi:uncharacterized protein GlcG (DUF336 family)
MMRMPIVAGALLAASMVHAADAPTHASRNLTPEAALAVARASLEHCRKQGYQVAVAVSDRAGVVVALLRDRHAGAHTPDMASGKAWTAASFRTSTLELAKGTQAGQPMSGIRNLPRVIAAGGGLPIEAAGSLVGAVGVSGAPGGEADEACARAGIAAIKDELDLQ